MYTDTDTQHITTWYETPVGAMAGPDSAHTSKHTGLQKYGGMHGPENFQHLKTTTTKHNKTMKE